jgi:hypothetical protein
MILGDDFLREELAHLRQEIRLRQSQIIDVEKSLIVLLAAICAVIFVGGEEAPIPVIRMLFAFLALLGAVLGGTKVLQNIIRILQIHQYIRRVEAYVLADLNKERGKQEQFGYESFLRTGDLLKSKLMQRVIRTETVNWIEISILILVFLTTLAIAIVLFANKGHLQ